MAVNAMKQVTEICQRVLRWFIAERVSASQHTASVLVVSTCSRQTFVRTCLAQGHNTQHVTRP